MCWTLPDGAPSLGEPVDSRPSLCAELCCRLRLLVAPKGQEKGNIPSILLTPSATLDIHDLEPRGSRGWKLAILGRYRPLRGAHCPAGGLRKALGTYTVTSTLESTQARFPQRAIIYGAADRAKLASTVR